MWDLLRQHLWTIPEEGYGGFEGLVAKLLSVTIGEPFRLASKGLQPGGDASNDHGLVAVQAKRYRQSTAINHSEVLGDVDRALSTHPQLECYVLAATRSIPNQLRAELNRKETSSGLDIITLGLGDHDLSLAETSGP